MKYDYEFERLNLEMEYEYLAYLTETIKRKWSQRAIKKNYRANFIVDENLCLKPYKLNKTNLSTRFFDYLEIFNPSVKECEKKYPDYRNKIIDLLEVFLDLLYTGKPKLKSLMHWTERVSEFIYQRYWPRECQELLKLEIKPTIQFHNYLIDYMARTMTAFIDKLQKDPGEDNFRRYLILEGNHRFENNKLWPLFKGFLYKENELLNHPNYKIVNIYDVKDLDLNGGL